MTFDMLYEWNNSAQEWVKVQRWNNSARKWESDGRREKTLSFDCPHCDRPCTGESEEEVYMDFRKHIMYMKDCNCYCKHKTEVIPKWLAELDSLERTRASRLHRLPLLCCEQIRPNRPGYSCRQRIFRKKN